MRASVHWFHQRISGGVALLIIPLVWYVYIYSNGLNFTDLVLVFNKMWVCLITFMVLLSCVYHARLGINVIVDDYMPKKLCKKVMISFDLLVSCVLLMVLYALSSLYLNS